MRTPLMLILSGMLAVGIFVTGDRKRMKTVTKWLKKGDFLSKAISWGMLKKVSRQLRW